MGYKKGIILLIIILEIIAIGLILFQFFLIFNSWSVIPDRVPVHFDISGKPNSWGEKKSLFILPIVSIILFLALTVAVHYPKIVGYLLSYSEEENRERVKIMAHWLIRLMKIIVLGLSTYIESQNIQIAIGKVQSLGYIPVVFLIILIIIAVITKLIFSKK